MNEAYIGIKRLTDTAKIPTRAHITDAGFDLYADESCKILQGKRQVVKTGISMNIPGGFTGLIWPRSGMAVNKGIHVMGGVIDAGYQGEIMVCLYNSEAVWGGGNPGHLQVEPGDRIAQIIIHEIPKIIINDMTDMGPDEDTDRSTSGFGSTGA
jgi:dUTP pyrophosphatase